MNKYGLIGYPLGHSFSKKYFTEKFERENIRNSEYNLYELKHIEELPLLMESAPDLRGLNVTIPYKEQVIPYLDSLDESAQKVGAVNVIKIHADGNKTGYNSDFYGFKSSLLAFLRLNTEAPAEQKTFPTINALVLGTGGASKAVKAALDELQIKHSTVSREASKADLSYGQLDAQHLLAHRLIINTTPVGTYPAIDACPEIPYQHINTHHLLYDLVYNPEVTLFMKKGMEQGAKAINGLEMLYLQAEKAWEIWQTS